MNFLNLILGRWSRRQRAMAIYQRAMAFANGHDLEAALIDYTSVIEMRHAPADVRAMALYNRSVVYSTKHDEAQAVRDLQLVLDIPRAPGNVRLEAKRKLHRIEQAASRLERDLPPHTS